MNVIQNISRLNYLLALYKMTDKELLDIINKGLKKPFDKQDIKAPKINLNCLKRIDKFFNKGIHYYLDPKTPKISKQASIFFRKTTFETTLNTEAKKVVNRFEEFKISLSAISKLAELNIERTLPVFTISDNPKTVAQQIRGKLYPAAFNPLAKEFLKELISTFAQNNIFVFEFVETWNKKEKANIDGFFLNPNVIVVKRQQSFFRREIFTLIHELGHYLINKEEIEQLVFLYPINTKPSAVERWCNDFAYCFLAGQFEKQIEHIDYANTDNDYYFDLIEDLSKKTHLSRIALFTRLLLQNKIAQNNYNTIKADLDKQYQDIQEQNKKKTEADKMQGLQKGGSTPKPINSPLLISTIQAAFHQGIINEYQFCKTLNISADKLQKYLQ